MPLHADDRDEGIRQNARYRGVGCEVLKPAHIEFIRMPSIISPTYATRPYQPTSVYVVIHVDYLLRFDFRALSQS